MRYHWILTLESPSKDKLTLSGDCDAAPSATSKGIYEGAREAMLDNLDTSYKAMGLPPADRDKFATVFWYCAPMKIGGAK